MKFMKSLEPLALLALRVALALIFVYHGYPKLAHANAQMREFFVSHGMPGYFLWVAGILECFGALLLFLGIFTRAIGLLLAIEMSVAIWKVHSSNGIMMVRDYEFPLTLATASFVLATVGPGLLSMDHLLFGSGGSSSGKRRLARAG
jgi:putative oxidoreductase